MRVADVMTRNVVLTRADATIQEAAARMAELDAGILPVSDQDRLIGMVTDRDIAVRGVAKGKGPDCTVGEVMTPEVKYVFEDDDIGDVARNMAEIKVQRLPVMNRDKRLVGIVSLGDIAVQADTQDTDTAVSGIKEPGGPHAQTEPV
jgi:CBS domain-containing protein